MATPKKPEAKKVDKFQETLNALNKKYGKGTILTLDSKPDTDLEVYSTGSLAFDHIALGIGGFAKGKLYELMGWEGTGKSTIAGHVTAECQKVGGKVLYIDGEHAVDKDYFRALGVDTDKMLFSQPACGEEGFNVALQMIETGEIDLVIIDSDSSLIPKKMLDGEVGDSAIGHKAKLNSSAYPKLKTALSVNHTCVIVISQYREKIGVMFGNPTVTQGGHALKFYTDCRVEVGKKLVKDGDQVIGNLTKIKVTKNKMAPPYMLATFEIIYGKGIDKIGEIIDLLKEHGLAKTRLDVIYFNEEKHNLEDFKEKVLSDPDFYQQIVDMIMDKVSPSNEV